MKVIDLVVLDFNLKLKDKTVFKVLNQIGHDKYIYNRAYRKFHVFEYEKELENIALVIDSKTIAWEIEIIEEPKEELEEIELIDIHYVNDKCIFKVNGQSIEETIAIKVNELINEVNKLKKEMEKEK